MCLAIESVFPSNLSMHAEKCRSTNDKLDGFWPGKKEIVFRKIDEVITKIISNPLIQINNSPGPRVFLMQLGVSAKS